MVGRAKGSFIAVLVCLLAAGWLSAAYSLTVDADVLEQTELIRNAEMLLEDKLYVRAAAMYVEALRYQTEYSADAQTRLLEIYKEGEMWEEYYFLLRERVSEETAAAQEYVILAQYYLDAGSTGSAITYLKQGRSLFPDDQELIDLDESVRYEYTAAATGCEKVGIPSEDYYIPAFDGEKWGYILDDGGTAIDFQYEEATRFSGNYAVVKIDGVYTLIDKDGYWNAVDKNGLDEVHSLCKTRIVGEKDGKFGIYTNTFEPVCAETYDNIYPSPNGLFFVQKDGKWALLDGDVNPVTDFIFTDVVPNGRGEAFYLDYAVVADEKGYYLVDPAGEPWFEARFSGAKGIEGGLVAVCGQNGEWGFIDETGSLVVECQYEDALSFSSRLGAVKYAGKWGYVNEYNTMVIPNAYESAEAFVGAIALATEKPGGYSILKMKYYDVYMGQ